jgi:hypothetical protein
MRLKKMAMERVIGLGSDIYCLSSLPYETCRRLALDFQHLSFCMDVQFAVQLQYLKELWMKDVDEPDLEEVHISMLSTFERKLKKHVSSCRKN